MISRINSDAKAIAEMLYIDNLNLFKQEKELTFLDLKDLEKDYISSLEASCSSPQVLLALTDMGVITKYKHQRYKLGIL